MSTRADLRGTPWDDADARCVVCGSPDWAAMWHGEIGVYICQGCALDVLPRLIADAAHWYPAAPTDSADATLDQVRTEYWRAVALRRGREARELARRSPGERVS